jgi:hypothetical protein
VRASSRGVADPADPRCQGHPCSRHRITSPCLPAYGPLKLIDKSGEPAPVIPQPPGDMVAAGRCARARVRRRNAGRRATGAGRCASPVSQSPGGPASGSCITATRSPLVWMQRKNRPDAGPGLAARVAATAANDDGVRLEDPAMAVELTPITGRDVAEVADFLRTSLDPQIPWARSCVPPWQVEAPNHGFMLRDGQRVVGALLAFYSDRLIGGRVERFCNMGTWCVLPAYRSHSIRLLRAMVAQDGYHVTCLSPNERVVAITAKFKFRPLDTAAVLIPNLPWPTLPGRTRISADPGVIASTLTGAELRLYHDHAEALAARHILLIRGERTCYVMYRETPLKGLPCAEILHVSNPELFKSSINSLTRHLLLRQRLLATRAELRTITHRPLFSLSRNPRPKRYRSASLDPGQIDDLYSEFVCVPDRTRAPRLLRRPGASPQDDGASGGRLTEAGQPGTRLGA